MLTIDFDNVEWHASFCGRRLWGESAALDMARLLTDEGWSDGPAVFVDERGVACFTVRSLHSMARRYRPNAEDKLARAERVKQRRSQNVDDQG